MCRACETSVHAAMVCRGAIAPYLEELPLLRGVPAEQLQRLAVAAGGVELEAGEWLFHQGEEADHVYVVAEGQIALYRLSLEGKESIVALVGTGEALGEEMLHQPRAPRDVGARATCDCLLVRIDRKVFHRVAESSPELAGRLLQTVHRRQKMLIDHIERLSVLDAGGRVIEFLLSLVGDQGGRRTVALPFAKRDLAAHLAIQPETLSRVFAKMKSRGLLWDEGGATVVDVDVLRAHRSCAHCELNCWGCPRIDDAPVGLVAPPAPRARAH